MSHKKRHQRFKGSGKTVQVTLPIKGMHCRSCELMVAENLEELAGVERAEVSLKARTAKVYATEMPSQQSLRQAVAAAGYEVGSDDTQPWVSRSGRDWAELGVCALLLSAFVLFLSSLGLLNFNSGVGGNPSSLMVVWLVGLTAGLSTCMALVGGLVLGVSARHAEKHPEATAAQRFTPHVFFNIGRIFSYFILGGLVGVLGSAFQIKGAMLGTLTIGVGIVMFILGAQLTRVFPRLSNGGLALPSGLSKALGLRQRHQREYSHRNAVVLGALTFFVPCGFTQAMQLYAMSTGNFWSGALIMSVFALGTAPGLLGIGGLTALIKGAFAHKFFRFVGVGVMGLASFNIVNGYNLTGLGNPFANASQTSGAVASLQDGVQVVRMKQTAYGYAPKNFTVQKDVPVKWVIDANDSSSCSSTIVVPKLDIQRGLKVGENVIEFTPTQTGSLSFTCIMGMYPGSFQVVEKAPGPNASAPAPSPADPDVQTPKSVSGSRVERLTTVYTLDGDINPRRLTAKIGQETELLVDVRDNGEGCMSTIMVPGLVDEPQLLTRGKQLSLKFTANKPGVYQITCAMGVPRGTITVS